MSRKSSTASTASEPTVPQADPPVPKADSPVPQADPPVPKADSPVPQTDPPVPKADSPVPQADPPVPKADSPIPQADPPILPPYEGRKSSSASLDKPSDVEKLDKDVKLKYPKSVFFIIVNEFCERFNYYGMRTVLTLYMRDILLFSEDLATVLYHTFLMLCYFTPIPGAILADTYLGKFKTIAILSVIYACGSVLLSISAIPMYNSLDTQVGLSMTGLLIIAAGTGGIKPCVSSFGGDQFIRPQQDRQLEAFFSVFYFSINAGSLISTFITPILREDVHCFDQDSCYPLAFGVPAILMIVAVIIFIVGKPMYTIKKPQGNIMGEFFKCIGHALKRKFKSKGEKHDHWLDFASDKYSKTLIEEIRRVLAVAFVFIPLPVFWALYDQQGSRWTFQATRMNGDLGGVVLKPDQMQIVNPLLILIFVPLFETVVYPLFKRCNLLTPLQRIGAGLVFCGLSFVVSGLLELQLEPTYAKIPGAGLVQLNFINTLPCQVNVSYYVANDNGTLQLDATQYGFIQDLEANQEIIARAYLTDKNCSSNYFETSDTGEIKLGNGSETQGYSILITEREKSIKIVRFNTEEQLEKSNSGDPYVAFFLDDKNYPGGSDGNITLQRVEQKKKTRNTVVYSLNETTITTPTIDNLIQTKYEEADIGTFKVFLNGIEIGQIKDLLQGGVYRIIIQKSLNETDDEYHLTTVVVTSPNTVNILWLLPQYFIVTIGEVMFSVTGLSFSFSQAPVSMKAVMQAIWLLVVAFGNLIDIIVIQFQSDMSQANEFFLFAGIMAVAVVIFTLMSLQYKYVDSDEVMEEKEKLKRTSSSSSSSSSSDDDETNENGKENEGFSE